MVVHMLVQIPLIAFAGWLLGGAFRIAALERWDRSGIATLLVALFCSLYWMLPRLLDAALQSGSVEAGKFASVALLIGVPLRWSWSRVSVLARGFVWSNLISMLLVLGWLYIAAPVRICNNYLLDQQTLAGRALIALALVIALWLTVRAFAAPPPAHRALPH